MSGVVSDFVEIDWSFIIGFVLSLSAVLLTYEATTGAVTRRRQKDGGNKAIGDRLEHDIR